MQVRVRRCARSGSPPPARRARRRMLLSPRRGRITSACAESTSQATGFLPWPTDHLRLRGEHRWWRRRLSLRAGSPPPARRARGWLEPVALPLLDHLRLRGEHPALQESVRDRSGSPPPARRALHRRRPGRPEQRITSACAESTPGPCRAAAEAADHLRLRGEHAAVTRRSRRTPDHLRLRGEHVEAALCLFVGAGSPPPARRAPQHHFPEGAKIRITSACAESTSPASKQQLAGSDHLRLRGEHEHRSAGAWRTTGSPPPARRAPTESRPR